MSPRIGFGVFYCMSVASTKLVKNSQKHSKVRCPYIIKNASTKLIFWNLVSFVGGHKKSYSWTMDWRLAAWFCKTMENFPIYDRVRCNFLLTFFRTTNMSQSVLISLIYAWYNYLLCFWRKIHVIESYSVKIKFQTFLLQ